MEGLLAYCLRHCKTLGSVILIGGLLLSLSASPAYANITSTFTGYAYGNLQGSGGKELIQSDFANHPSGCPNDPAASWPYGTIIETLNPKTVTLYSGSGSPTAHEFFWLYDTGDPACTMPNYWVDIYHGRNATQSEYNSGCPCEGSPFPGVCSPTSRSNCQDAENFGSPTYTYVRRS